MILHFPHSTQDVVHLVAMIAAAALIVGIPVLAEYFIINSAYLRSAREHAADDLDAIRALVETTETRSIDLRRSACP